MASGPHGYAETIGAEALLRGVGPFEKAVGGKNQQITRSHIQRDRWIGKERSGDAEGQGVGFEKLETIVFQPVEEKRSMAGGGDFQRGCVEAEAAGDKVDEATFLDVPAMAALISSMALRNVSCVRKLASLRVASFEARSVALSTQTTAIVIPVKR
jgi:hypothetical protein